jgi:DNA-binding NarL/FixJ family response regulator
MDLSMPVLDGVAATRRIVCGLPGTVVVVLTSFSDRRRAGEALGAGAVSYLVKDCDPHDIIAAVRHASRGGSTVDPRVARGLQARPCRAAGDAAPGGQPGRSWAAVRVLRRHRD